jgi:antitoxin FitA
MELALELTDSQLEALRARAKSLGISAEQLASAAVADLVAQPVEDFERAASRILSKNAELYRRLAG